jgi:hypothetical protein
LALLGTSRTSPILINIFSVMFADADRGMRIADTSTFKVLAEKQMKCIDILS